MAYYCGHLSLESITLKHRMEEHMIPFLREGVSFGLLGKQGAECIHHEFNMIRQRYTNNPGRTTTMGNERASLEMLPSTIHTQATTKEKKEYGYTKQLVVTYFTIIMLRRKGGNSNFQQAQHIHNYVHILTIVTHRKKSCMDFVHPLANFATSPLSAIAHWQVIFITCRAARTKCQIR